MKIKRATLISYAIFLWCNFLYFYFFVYTKPIETYDNAYLHYYSLFYFPINFDYLKNKYIFDAIKGGADFVLSQDYFVSYFYVRLGEWTQIDYNSLAFFVNNVFFIFSYYFANKLLEVAKLQTKYAYLFFLNPQLIYYSQMVTKEAATLFFILCLAYFALTHKWLRFIVAAIFATLVRQQLLIFAVFLYFIFTAKNYKWTLVQMYFVSGIGAAMLAGIAGQALLDDPDVLGAGFSYWLVSLNQTYYIGNLLFAPVKVVQWMYDQLKSLWFVTPDGYINLYLLRDVPVIVVLAVVSRRLIAVFSRIRIYSGRGERILISSVVAYVLVLLINPFVHQRYLFPIEVLLIILGLCVPRQMQMLKQPLLEISSDPLPAQSVAAFTPPPSLDGPRTA